MVGDDGLNSRTYKATLDLAEIANHSLSTFHNGHDGAVVASALGGVLADHVDHLEVASKYRLMMFEDLVLGYSVSGR